MNSRTSRRVKAAVDRLLRQTRIRKPPVRIQHITRNLGIKIRYEPFESDISGVLYRDKNTTIIGVNSLHHPNRQRFTIAHELGHFLLHEIDVHVDRGYRVVLRDSASSKATDTKEIEANHFAAELLMPERMLSRDVQEYLKDLEDEAGLQELASLYGVSTQALAFRLAKLGLLS